MIRQGTASMLVAGLVAMLGAAWAPAAERAAMPPAAPASAAATFDAGRLGQVAVLAPAAAPSGVVLLLSAANGPDAITLRMARELQGLGALVGVVDLHTYLPALRADAAACSSPAADLEALAHGLQKRAGVAGYRPALLAGFDAGAALAYAAAAEAQPGTFAGSIALGFCRDLPTSRPLCRGAGLGAQPVGEPQRTRLRPTPGLSSPWIALHGEQDPVCPLVDAREFFADIPQARLVPLPRAAHGFGPDDAGVAQLRDAYLKLVTAAGEAAPAAPAVAGLPLIEVPATAGTSSALAVLLTGDGGYAGLDQALAAELAAHGVPVVAFSTLKYFWRERTAAEAASDIDRVLRHYLTTWRKERVLLVGYSFGADVLPFIVNALPPASRGRVATLNLLGLAPRASFEIHVADWIPGTTPAGRPVAPEFRRGPLPATLCLFGADETDSLCPRLPRAAARPVKLPGGHHFNNDAVALAAEILRFAAR